MSDDLLAALGDQPGVVFTSQLVSDDVRASLVGEGFEIAPMREPLMRARLPPPPAPGPFHIAPATIEIAYHNGTAPVWLAWDGDEPVSVVWLCRGGGTLGVAEMMTPARHQRRGAGRQLLSTALAGLWTAETTQSILLSTPAGRTLYESLGFVAEDDVISCFRGHDQAVMAAIGQPSAG